MELFDHKILEKIGERLLGSKSTISVAESVTSGLLQWAMSGIPNAERFFQGGITAYNLGQKYRHLHVEPIHALSVNSVSPEVAKQMAMNVARLFQSDWSIAITGYASPVPESGNKLFAFYCIVYKDKVKLKGKLVPSQQDPQKVQAYYGIELLKKLLQQLTSARKTANLNG